MRYAKLHGCGNDYVFVDCRCEPDGVEDPVATAIQVSDRRDGIGSDGLILIRPSTRGDVRMEMYNADGCRGAMCGNGIRCLGKYVLEHDADAGVILGDPGDTHVVAKCLTVDTDDGLKRLYGVLQYGRVNWITVEMGRASLCLDDMACTWDGASALDRPLVVGGHRFELTCVSVGSLHAVAFVDDVVSVPLSDWGPVIERADIFPERINAHFAQVVAPDQIRMRPWERGSGATEACGTGGCAVVVAGVATGRCMCHCRVDQPGGAVFVHLEDGDSLRPAVTLSGPAETMNEGEWVAPGGA